MNLAPGLPLGPLRLGVAEVEELARLLATRGGLVLLGVKVYDRYEAHVYDGYDVGTRLPAQLARDLRLEFHGCRLTTSDQSVTVVLEPERASLLAHSHDPLGTAVVALLRPRRDRRVAVTSPAVLGGATVAAGALVLLVLVLLLGSVLSPTVLTLGKALCTAVAVSSFARAVYACVEFSGARIR